MKKNCLKTFLLCLFISIIIFFKPLFIDNGILKIVGDFQDQQIPFNINVNNELDKGNNMYTFNNDLGSSIIEGYSFYNLGSPFFLISILFNAKLYPCLIVILLILKFSLTGLFSYIYLEKFVNNKNLAILGSILYAFSGFQINSIYFYHFIDSVMVFPLILYSLDLLMLKNKKNLFIFMLALSIIINYVFAFGQILFILIYLTINFIKKRFIFNKKNIKKLIYVFVISILLSLPVLLPSVISVLNNPRLENSIQNIFIYPIQNYIKIFQSLLFYTDSPYLTSIINETNFKSCELYLPFFSIFLSCIYVIKNKKDYISTILITLLTFMFIPFLNSSFSLFNNEYYARWYYIVSLFLVISSIKVLDLKLDFQKNKLYNLIIYIYILLTAYFVIYISANKHIFTEDYKLKIFLSLICLLLIPFVLKKFYKTNKVLILFIPVIIMTLFQGTNFVYKNTNSNKNKDLNSLINEKIIDDEEFFRVKYYSCQNSNLNLYSDMNSVDSFNSTISPSSFKFYNSLGIKRKQSTSLPMFYDRLFDYLSVKYVINCSSTSSLNSKYKYLYEVKNFKVYKNSNYKKMGIFYTKLDKIKPYSNYKNIYLKIDSLFNNIDDKVLLKTKEISNGIKSTFTSSKDGYILYTIPYDKNFILKVNNSKQKYINYNNFIAFKVEKGYNEVKLSYDNKPFKIGLIICLITFIYLILKEKRKI